MKRLPVLVFFVAALSSPNLGGNQAVSTQATATSAGTAPIRPPATPSRTTA